MKERPIIFSTEMVQALLQGRKTQTRRLVKNAAKPYCQPGDVLWVRESYVRSEQFGFLYKADDDGSIRDTVGSFKPSMFMPREAARLLLKVEHVSIQQLCDISVEDAIAEGVDEQLFESGEIHFRDYLSPSIHPEWRYRFTCPVRSYRSLWEKLYDQDSWLSEMVWVIKFKVEGATA